MPENSYKLTWDNTGERIYETGVKQGVLYPKNDTGTSYQNGVAWNGLISVSESPSGAEESPIYADDIKYLSLYSNEEFGASVEAYTYPDEWAQCDGSASIADGVYIGQQTRRGFGMSYVTTVGNDGVGTDYGEKVHIIYNAMASPSEKSYSTINDSPEAITFSWTITTTPIDMPTINGKKMKKSATMVIDTTKISDSAKEAIYQHLYGHDNTDPQILMPEDVITIIESNPMYKEVSSTSTGYSEKNPKDENWYELSASKYVKTTDTTPQEGKTYYIKDKAQ